MTPKREAYLARCSDKEKSIRMILKTQQRALKQYKELLTHGYADDEDYCYFKIALYKTSIQALRHELNRLKGMNNIVVPRQVRMAVYPASHGFGFGYECVAIGLCACGAPLRDDECKYCQRCGKRVLWEKVK